MAQFKGIKCNFPKVAEDFKMIENDTKTVFIPIEEEAQDLLQQLKYQGFTKTSMKSRTVFCYALRRCNRKNGSGRHDRTGGRKYK